jgi:hypothetical protein
MLLLWSLKESGSKERTGWASLMDSGSVITGSSGRNVGCLKSCSTRWDIASSSITQLRTTRRGSILSYPFKRQT